jgi:hypothetical protein
MHRERLRDDLDVIAKLHQLLQIASREDDQLAHAKLLSAQRFTSRTIDRRV